MPSPKNLIDSSENHFGRVQIFAAPRKDDGSQNIPKKLTNKGSEALELFEQTLAPRTGSINREMASTGIPSFEQFQLL
uniref:Uncharacterized protein n=1 Tax=Rhizophagus irregularis (strain DAOM 181602 / DAOM 197198 / MUCL 43194) TaxID=747089 RepID=U9TKP1_RHIID